MVFATKNMDSHQIAQILNIKGSEQCNPL